jgi:beta-lactamase superfamily II metal-dependent hydrolase
MLTLSGAALAQRDTTDIYWIDVEGGAATLIVTPAGQGILMDAGWQRDDDRDTRRIMAAMADAGIEDLDYFLASHFHADHIGGFASLSQQVSIAEVIDHGDSVEADSSRHGSIWDAYLGGVDGIRRRAVAPGDTLPLDGVDFRFIAANHEVIAASGTERTANAWCEGAPAGEPDDSENSRSIAYLLSVGPFDFVDVGDLTENVQHELVCPYDRVGEVDLLQVPHHGNDIAAHFVATLNPLVAVSNTGAGKGGSAEGYDAMHSAPDLRAYWQIHKALASGDDHNASEPMIANLTEEDDRGYWIKAEIAADGARFELINARNGHRATYLSR